MYRNEYKNKYKSTHENKYENKCENKYGNRIIIECCGAKTIKFPQMDRNIV